MKIEFNYFQSMDSISLPTIQNVAHDSENIRKVSKDIYHEFNPLSYLPWDLRESITTDFYESGKSSIMQRYVENNFLNNSNQIQKLFNDMYHYAVRTDNHIVAWNTIVVLSQISYDYLGTWADMLAISATRNKFLDVQEMGIRCFENWENYASCSFLKGLTFSESWLQEYANEVCAYVEEEGQRENVLSEKNYPREMAWRTIDSTSNVEGYSSGYASCRVQDNSKQVVGLAS